MSDTTDNLASETAPVHKDIHAAMLAVMAAVGYVHKGQRTDKGAGWRFCSTSRG